MPDSFAIYALRRKRARMAGEIEAISRDLSRKREALATLDAVIRMFEPATNPDMIPAIRPTRRGMFFRHGELTRLCASALREAGKPIAARQVAEYAMGAKGLVIEDRRVRDGIIERVRAALTRLAEKGIARKIVEWPETWWELAI